MIPRDFWSERIFRRLSLVLLLATWAAPAVAQNGIFADAFESGSFCAWSTAMPAPPATTVDPAEISIGGEVTIIGCALNGSAPSVSLSAAGGDTGPLDVTSYEPYRIVAQLNSGLSADLYDVNVAQSSGGSVVVSDGVTVRLPSDLSFDPEFAGVTARVTMTGSFFGSPEGTIGISQGGFPSLGQAPIVSWDDGQVVLRCPRSRTTAPMTSR